jgi:hypothetical protein
MPAFEAANMARQWSVTGRDVGRMPFQVFFFGTGELLQAALFIVLPVIAVWLIAVSVWPSVDRWLFVLVGLPVLAAIDLACVRDYLAAEGSVAWTFASIFLLVPRFLGPLRPGRLRKNVQPA